jgi:hypothetical protein
MSNEYSRNTAVPAEFKILRAMWRWLIPIVLVSVLAAAATWYAGRSDVPVHVTQSELLVRVGYEYSPVPWSSVSETQQINFRADEVIGTEIQFLTSEETIQKALVVAPHAALGPATNGRYDAAQVMAVRQKLAVKRVEGSNVILVEVTDTDEVWSLAFSKALLDAYLSFRRQLFSNPDYDRLLAESETETRAALAKLDSEALLIGRQIAEASRYLTDTGAALAASPAQPELRDTLFQDIRALQIYVAGTKDMSAVESALDRVARALNASSAATVATTTIDTRVSEDLVTTAVDQLAADVARLADIAAEREGLLKQMDTVRTAHLRKSMRDTASHNMTVMTAPRVLAVSPGIDGTQRTLLAGLMAFILASLFFVYVDGLRRRSL